MVKHEQTKRSSGSLPDGATHGGSVNMLSQSEIVSLLKNRQDAIDVLVHHFRPLVLRTARQYAHVGFEEAVQEGYVALLEAIDMYDETLCVPFAGYVAIKVRGDVRTAMRRVWRYQERVTYPSHRRDSDASDAVAETEAWDKQLADQAALDAWDDYDSADIRMAIAAVKLSDRERQAIHSLLLGETSAELAATTGVGVETAKTWRKRGLHKLRAALGGED